MTNSGWVDPDFDPMDAIDEMRDKMGSTMHVVIPSVAGKNAAIHEAIKRFEEENPGCKIHIANPLTEREIADLMENPHGAKNRDVTMLDPAVQRLSRMAAYSGAPAAIEFDDGDFPYKHKGKGRNKGDRREHKIQTGRKNSKSWR